MFEKWLKNFNINFNASNERGTVSSGDLITGHISFELIKETKITSIAMALKGKANVHWSSGGGGKNRSSRHYSASLDFFNLKSAIVQGNSDAGGSTRLQAGTHVYPFTCPIPQGNFPSTFHGVHGRITYTLKVGIYRPWHMSKDFVTELNFVQRMNAIQPVLWYPLSGTNTMTLCCLSCASGPISLTASTEKKAFIPGETIKVFCDVQNASSRTAYPKLKLKQKQSFYTHNKVSQRIVSITMASVTGEPVTAHTSITRTETKLIIPPSAALSISNCSILVVEYFVEVTLAVSCCPDLTVLIPIILCDTAVNPQPPQCL